MLGEKNSIKICEVKELVVIVSYGYSGFSCDRWGVVLSANPKSYKRHCHPKCHG